MNKTLTLQEILQAMEKAWTFANETDETGTFVRPDYRRAMSEVWEDILIAAEMKHKEPDPSINLNVAMAKLNTEVLS